MEIIISLNDVVILLRSHMHTRGVAVPQNCRLSAWCQIQFSFQTFARSLSKATLTFATHAVTSSSTVKVGNDQENAQPERNSDSKNRDGKCYVPLHHSFYSRLSAVVERLGWQIT